MLKKYIIAGVISLSCGGGNFREICSACGRYEIQYTE